MADSGSAAGKLMIGGEYAVLTGRCRSLAVAVGAIARWSLHDGTGVSLSAFGQHWQWDAPANAPDGIGQLVQQCLNDAEDHGFGLSRRLRLSIKGEVGGAKVGLGTSASTVVATMTACAASINDSVPHSLLEARAHASHRASQGGKGSGYDIGTILTGGCALYDRPSQTSTSLAWPDGLYGAALFTGSSASTVTAISRPLSDAVLNEIAGATESLIGTWSAGDPKTVIAALSGCEHAFNTAAQERPWLLPNLLKEARQFIDDFNCQPRVSGAGGGDCILAFSDSARALTALTQEWQQQGRVVVAQLPEAIATSGSQDGEQL